MEKLKIANFGASKGLGVVTNQWIQKGQFVCVYQGPLLTYEEALRVEQRYDDVHAGSYMFFFRDPRSGKKLCIDATYLDLLSAKQLSVKEATRYLETTGIARYLNHSRSGNLIVKAEIIEGEPQLVFYAKNNISPGTELIYDYGERRSNVTSDLKWLLT